MEFHSPTLKDHNWVQDAFDFGQTDCCEYCLGEQTLASNAGRNISNYTFCPPPHTQSTCFYNGRQCSEDVQKNVWALWSEISKFKGCPISVLIGSIIWKSYLNFLSLS